MARPYFVWIESLFIYSKHIIMVVNQGTCNDEPRTSKPRDCTARWVCWLCAFSTSNLSYAQIGFSSGPTPSLFIYIGQTSIFLCFHCMAGHVSACKIRDQYWSVHARLGINSTTWDRENSDSFLLLVIIFGIVSMKRDLTHVFSKISIFY